MPIESAGLWRPAAPLGDLAEARELRPDDAVEVLRRHRLGHPHQADDVEALEPLETVQKIGRRLWRHAVLGVLARDVDLDEAPKHAPGARGPLVELAREARAVQRVEEVGALGHDAGLVALQAADEVPDHVVSEGVGFVGELAGAVLAEVAQARVEGGAEHVEAVRLGHGDERDVVRIAAGSGAGVGDALADGVEAGGERLRDRSWRKIAPLADVRRARPQSPTSCGCAPAASAHRAGASGAPTLGSARGRTRGRASGDISLPSSPTMRRHSRSEEPR